MAKAQEIKTYNPKEVMISVGGCIVSGYAEDSFVTIEPNAQGTQKIVGCDGEIARALDPDNTYKVRIALLQTSDANSYLQSMRDLDYATGEGMFPIIVKDLRGGTLFQAEQAWVTRSSGRVFGRTNQNREWELDTGAATISGN